MDVSVVTDDNVTDSYYTKTDDTTVSFAMYSKSFKIENILSEVPPAETPEKTFIVTKDTDGSEMADMTRFRIHWELLTVIIKISGMHIPLW